jgi:hypothetical protein
MLRSLHFALRASVEMTRLRLRASVEMTRLRLLASTEMTLLRDQALGMVSFAIVASCMKLVPS